MPFYWKNYGFFSVFMNQPVHLYISQLVKRKMKESIKKTLFREYKHLNYSSRVEEFDE